MTLRRYDANFREIITPATVNGRTIATDGTKLDGIETGAEANVGQFLSLGFGSSVATSGTTHLYSYGGSKGSGGTGGYALPIEYDCSLVGIAFKCEVSAWTSGDLNIKLYRLLLGVSDTNFLTLTPGVTGTANPHQYRTTYSPLTHNFDAGDSLRISVEAKGTMTIDDCLFRATLQLDSPVG